jgi:hypothetical protein
MVLKKLDMKIIPLQATTALYLLTKMAMLIV